MADKSAVILSVGGSPEPLIFCLENYDYDLVYFLHSKDTKEQAFEIIDELNIPEDKYRFKLTDHQSLEEAFAKSREIIKELQKENYDINIDFTGGTKPMVSGLVLAAIGEDCGYTYVGSEKERTKDNVGIVKSGFEELKEQKDPYNLFAVFEFERGKDFFDIYQFEAAKVNFEDANKKLDSEKLKELSEIYLNIVKLYHAWDNFNYEVYNSSKNELLTSFLYHNLPKMEEFESNLNEDNPDFVKQLKNNYEFLKLKISRNGNIPKDDVKFYLADLLNNVSRRIEEGKYDDAVARLYRAIELVGQMLLLELGLIHENALFSNQVFVVSKEKIDDLNDDYLEAKNFLMEFDDYNDSEKPNIKIGLKDNFYVLDKLGIEIAGRYLQDKDIDNNITMRNSSILAHGLKSIEKEKARELFDQVLKYAKEVFPEVEEYMEMAKFPKFSNS